MTEDVSKRGEVYLNISDHYDYCVNILFLYSLTISNQLNGTI